MKPPDLAQLLRELANELKDRIGSLALATDHQVELIARARAAAEEIEARKSPTDAELMAVYLRCSLANSSTLDGLRGILARFGGGEVGE